MAEVTHILNTSRTEELIPLVYEELRRMAAARMAQESPGQTLQATALVHEAWMRLSSGGGAEWQNRAHFFGAAGEAMRRILVDKARRKQQLKRGGNPERVELDEAGLAVQFPDDKLLQVHEALDALAREDPLKAEVVKLRYFVGLNHEEIATALGLNEKTIRRHWQLAKIKLFDLISQS